MADEPDLNFSVSEFSAELDEAQGDDEGGER